MTSVKRAARTLFLVALGLLAGALLLVTVEMFLTASLLDEGHEFRGLFWVTSAIGVITATLCLLDVAALVVSLRGRALLAQYRRERSEWREVRAAQGSLLRRR
jgi:Na+/melibiose symporter-like transporter